MLRSSSSGGPALCPIGACAGGSAAASISATSLLLTSPSKSEPARATRVVKLVMSLVSGTGGLGCMSLFRGQAWK